jgi:anti-sigma factor (TIGR02949 family)
MTDHPKDPCAPANAPGAVDCSAVMQQLWAYLDEELGPERMTQVRTHLALCAQCYPYYDFEKAFLEAIADCRCTTCAPYDVRCHVMDALRSAGFTPGEGEGAVSG